MTPRHRHQAGPLPEMISRQRLVVVFVLACLVVAGPAALQLRDSRLAHEERTAATARNLAQTLEHGIALTFERIDHTLLSVGDEVRRQLTLGPVDNAALEAFLAQREERLPEILSLLVADPQGHLTHGSILKKYGTTASIAHRAYFQQARDDPGAGLLISKPLPGQWTGVVQVVLARRLDRQDGRFGGLVLAAISLERFAQQFARLELGPHGVVVLKDQDAALIVRHPPQPGEPGQPGAIGITPELRAIRSEGRREATFTARSPVDAVSRVNAYRVIQGTAWFLLVGTALEDALTEWYAEVGRTLAFTVALLALLGLALGRLDRANRQQESILARLENGNTALRSEVAEREKTEQLLRKAQRTLGTLLDNFPGMIYHCHNDPQWTMEYVSEGCRLLTGYDPDELLHNRVTSFGELIEAGDRTMVWEQVQEAVAQRAPYILEYRIRTRNGELKQVWEMGRGVFEEGQLQALEGFITDITARKQVELSLRASEQRLRDILNHTSAVVFMKDLEGRYLFVNRQYEELFHVRNEELQGKTDHDLFPAEVATAVQANDRLALAASTSIQADERVPQDDGDHDYISVKFPLRDGDGRPYAVCGIATDITERKRMEADLRQAKEAAEAASRAKSDFLSIMSHEMRTPMNVVIGMGEVLLETELTAEQRVYVERLQAAGNGLLELIDQVLDLSKIEAGKLQVVAEPVPVARLLRETAALMGVIAEGKGLRVRCAVEETVPKWLTLDGTRLRQVMFNLVGNAVKFSERGEVVVQAAVVAGEPDRLLVTVQDEGIGIEAAHLERIFEPFTQADSGIARRFGGTGLGLSLTHRLVTLMGGSIRVTSAVGVGSTFQVALPLVPAEATVAEDNTETDHSQDPALRILLVEDAPDNQLLICAFLKRTPHHLTIAADGQEAVQLFQSGRFDLVLMDIQMPVMDGHAATRLIRQWEQASGREPTPIFALTAHTLEGEARLSQEAGCDLHLGKPIKKQRLLEALRSVAPRVDRV